eukprot:174033_1
MPIKAIVRITLMICFATTLLLYVSCSQLACSDFTGESSCNSQTDTKCKWVANSTTAGACNCASAVQLDILFAIDASGTVGPDGWEIQKEFIGTLVLQDINNGSKIGFVLFSTKVNFSKSIQTWQTEELDNYVSGLYWQQGYTNTPGAVNASILEFSGSNPAGAINPYVPDPERQITKHPQITKMYDPDAIDVVAAFIKESWQLTALPNIEVIQYNQNQLLYNTTSMQIGTSHV